MSLSQALFLLAQADTEDLSAPGFFSAPTFFFAFLSLCLIMIIVAAVFERMGQADQEENLEEDPADLPDSQSPGDEEVDAKEELRRAKREAKEQKKREREEKKQAKAAAKKAKKSKGKDAGEPSEQEDDLEKLLVD